LNILNEKIIIPIEFLGEIVEKFFTKPIFFNIVGLTFEKI